MEECRKIFLRASNHDSHHTMGAFDRFEQESSISVREYQTLVRQKVLEILQLSGVKASSFESIDGDEIFVKLSLARDGEVIRNLAQRYQYKMPFRSETYADVPGVGSYPGSRPWRTRSTSTSSGSTWAPSGGSMRSGS